MLTAVQLDDQPGGGTIKIHDIWANRLLTSKAQTANLLPAQIRPESMFRIGHFGAKLASELAFQALPTKVLLRSRVRVHTDSQWPVPSPKTQVRFRPSPKGRVEIIPAPAVAVVAERLSR